MWATFSELLPSVVNYNGSNLKYREGRFERIASLDARAICGPSMHTSTVTVPMGSPECAGNVKVVELSTGLPVASRVL